jgi:poly-gamma-glutamate synthesis protein (capsule biosynthesis protein)
MKATVDDMRHGPVTLFLSGDVMSGRGVDQILPDPGDPRLREGYVRDARSYVQAAEAVHGRIARPVRFSWPWGSALRTIDDVVPDARLVNLETSVTRSDEFSSSKYVHYRMSPGNVRCVASGRPDVCVLANNHVLDFGRRGLEDTLNVLTAAGLRWVGAGRDAREASEPAAIPVNSDSRVVVLAAGAVSSGIPPDWAATAQQPGVNVLVDLSDTTAAELADQARVVKRRGDVVVASLHWGSNWGYDISNDQVHFAHRLIDNGVDVVHGHSSHHPRPIEVYRDKLVLYGCGDFIDDYEGIAGNEHYRNDLRLLYFPSVEPETGRLAGLRMVPMQSRKMQLRHASRADSEWLQSVLTRISHGFGTRVALDPDGALVALRA